MLILRQLRKLIPLYVETFVTEDFMGNINVIVRWSFVNQRYVTAYYNFYQYYLFLIVVEFLKLVITFLIFKTIRYCVRLFIKKIISPGADFVNNIVLRPAYNKYVLPRYQQHIEPKIKPITRNSKLISVKNSTLRLITKITAPYVNARIFLRERRKIKCLIKNAEEKHGHKIVNDTLTLKRGGDNQVVELLISSSNTTSLVRNITLVSLINEIRQWRPTRILRWARKSGVENQDLSPQYEKKLSPTIIDTINSYFSYLGAYKVELDQIKAMENVTLSELAGEGRIFLIQSKSKAGQARLIVFLGDFLLFHLGSGVKIGEYIINLFSKILSTPSVWIPGTSMAWYFDVVKLSTFKKIAKAISATKIGGQSAALYLAMGMSLRLLLNWWLLIGSLGLGVTTSLFGIVFYSQSLINSFLYKNIRVPGNAHNHFDGIDIFCPQDGEVPAIIRAPADLAVDENSQVYFYTDDIRITDEQNLAYFLDKSEQNCSDYSIEAKNEFDRINLEIASSKPNTEFNRKLPETGSSGSEQKPLLFDLGFYGIPRNKVNDSSNSFKRTNPELGKVILVDDGPLEALQNTDQLRPAAFQEHRDSIRKRRAVTWSEFMEFMESRRSKQPDLPLDDKTPRIQGNAHKI